LPASNIQSAFPEDEDDDEQFDDMTALALRMNQCGHIILNMAGDNAFLEENLVPDRY
jgi:hypothetical protein